MTQFKFDTLSLHAGYEPKKAGVIFPPITMGVAFPFESFEDARAICNHEKPGFVYARTGNPTNAVLEQRLAALEGGEGCLVTSSGNAAIFITCLELMKGPGAEFVTSNRLYGNTQNLFRVTFPVMGFKAQWVQSPDKLEAWEAQINPKTSFLYVESPSNPDVFVADLKGLAAVARSHGIPLVVDNTLASPAVVRPIDLGATMVVHSTTKYLAGHSAALGGALVGPRAIVESARDGHHHYVGPSMSAFNAWLTLIGIETLSLRMHRCISNAQLVAEYLERHLKVEFVNFPGLASHPQYRLAAAQLGCAGTSLLSFVVKGGVDGARTVIGSLRVPIHATHLGSNQSVVVNPATTTHGKIPPELRAIAGVPDGLIRYAVGLEDPEDLIADLDQALALVA